MDDDDNYHHNVNASHDHDQAMDNNNNNEVSGVMLTMAMTVWKAAQSQGCWAASAHTKPSHK